MVRERVHECRNEHRVTGGRRSRHESRVGETARLIHVAAEDLARLHGFRAALLGKVDGPREAAPMKAKPAPDRAAFAGAPSASSTTAATLGCTIGCSGDWPQA